MLAQIPMSTIVALGPLPSTMIKKSWSGGGLRRVSELCDNYALQTFQRCSLLPQSIWTPKLMLILASNPMKNEVSKIDGPISSFVYVRHEPWRGRVLSKDSSRTQSVHFISLLSPSLPALKSVETQKYAPDWSRIFNQPFESSSLTLFYERWNSLIVLHLIEWVFWPFIKPHYFGFFFVITK